MTHAHTSRTKYVLKEDIYGQGELSWMNYHNFMQEKNFM